MEPAHPEEHRSWRPVRPTGVRGGSYDSRNLRNAVETTRPIRISVEQHPRQRRQQPPPRPTPTGSAHIDSDQATIQYNVRTSSESLGLVRRSQPATSIRRRSASPLTESLIAPVGAQLNSPMRRPSTPNTRGAISIAVLSLKGGVGKTTTTVCLGAMLASTRGERVIAVDANPDFGTLAQRGQNTTRSTVRHLLADSEIRRYSDVSRHTSRSASRLEILGSERDPAVSEAFSETDYRAVHTILDRFYDVILTDCGTGLTHSAMTGVLDTADALVIASSPAIDSARSALATLDWLQHRGYEHLVSHATLALNAARPGAAPIDVNKLTQHFKSRVADVFVIPYDDHLAEGAEINVDLLKPKTRRAFSELTAAVFNRFTRNRRIMPSGQKLLRWAPNGLQVGRYA